MAESSAIIINRSGKYINDTRISVRALLSLFSRTNLTPYVRNIAPKAEAPMKYTQPDISMNDGISDTGINKRQKPII